MTVKELKEYLADKPDDMEILAWDYKDKMPAYGYLRQMSSANYLVMDYHDTPRFAGFRKREK